MSQTAPFGFKSSCTSLLLLVGLALSCASATESKSDVTDSSMDASSLDGAEVSATDATSGGDSGSAGPTVTVVTNMGSFTLLLNPSKAPLSTENFLGYVDDGFYDGDDGLGATTFHRVISGFMVQGGGVKESGATKSTKTAIMNESTNGLLNLRGTVAMARTNAPHSATSQFFVNHVDNPFLDYKNEGSPGYAVFGEVIDGMDVIDAIAAVPVGANDVPITPVLIEDVFRP